MGKTVLLTAKKVLGQGEPGVNVNKVVAIPEVSIVEVKPKDNGLGSIITTDLGGYGAGKKFEVMESAAEVEAARNPSSSDPYVKNYITLGGAATGTAQGDGLDALKYLTEVTTATDTSAEAVDLPAATVGALKVVVNNTAIALEVFPASGETINGAAANAVYDMPANSRKHFYCEVAGAWKIAEDNTVR